MTTEIEAFLNYLRFEKRFSPHTVISYTTDLQQFKDYLQTVYNTNDLKEVNYLYIRSWLAEMLEKKVNPRTVNRKISTLKTFYKYLLKQKIVSENPLVKIQSPKTSKRLPVFIEKDKMQELFNFDFPDTFEGLRDKLILEIFYATGIRLSELINLTKNNVNLYDLNIKVLGKRNKERSIPITFNLKNSIEQYLERRKEIETSEELFFISSKGKKLDPKTVYNIVKSHLNNATTLSKKSPHVLRHTFATHMLNNGADINAIKELLGHSSLAATQVYTHNTIEKLKNIHKLAHPKA